MARLGMLYALNEEDVKKLRSMPEEERYEYMLEEIEEALFGSPRSCELDKAWETSWIRRICICILTYIIVVIYSYMINSISNIWFSSLVPVIGFALSTASLKFIRRIWEKNK